MDYLKKKISPTIDNHMIFYLSAGIKLLTRIKNSLY